MKKWIALLLAAVMLISVMTACGNKTNDNNNDQTQNDNAPETPDAPEVNEQPSDPVLSGDLAAIIDAIYAIAPSPLPVGTMPIDLADEFMLGAYTGLTDKTPIKEAAFSESMIGAQAYSVVLVRLNDAADAETVANSIADNVDQRKWVCVEADSLRVVAYKDLVLLVMIDSQLDIKVNTLIEAFGTLCGNPFTVDIDRTTAGGSAFDPSNVDLSGDLSLIIEGIYAIAPTPLPVMTMPVMLEDAFSVSSATGLADATKIKDAVYSESMIGAQGYSVVLVRLNDAADAEAVATAMKDGINQRKWVCVEADDLRVVAVDDLVLLVMIDSQLDIKVNTLIEAFGTLCGKDFTVDMTK